MSKEEEHKLKMDFARQILHGTTTPDRPRRRKNGRSQRGTVDYSRGYQSIGLSVAPNQVQEMRDLTKKHGLTGITYSDDGRCTVESRGHRKEFLKIRGMRDNDGGYGD